MSYKIRYDTVGKRKYPPFIRHKRFWRVSIGAAVLVCIFGLVSIYYGGAQWLLPGDPAVTSDALSELVDTLKDGASFSDAVTAFCRDIIDGAKIS